MAAATKATVNVIIRHKGKVGEVVLRRWYGG